MSRTGKCLCGAVTFTAEPMPTMQACHCDMCRKWGGGPYMSTPCTNAVFDGPVTAYASSEIADRGFCATCGSHLFYFAKAAGIHAVLSDPAIERIQSSPLEAVLITNTTPLEEKLARCDKLRPLSVAPILGEAIRRTHENTSVSSLFV